MLCGLAILYLLSTSVKRFSEVFTRIAVASGKYISRKVVTHTDAPEGILQHPAVSMEQGSNEPLTMVPCQRSAPQEQSSQPSMVPERAASSREHLMTFRSLVSVASKAQSHLNAATLSPCPKVEPASTKGPTDHASLEETTLQIDPEIIEEPTSGQPSTGAENDGPLQSVPLTIDTSIDIQHSTDADDQISHLDGEIVAKLVSCHISEEDKDSRALELESRTIGLLPEDKEDENSPQRTARSADDLAQKRFVSEVHSELQGRGTPTCDNPDTSAPIMRNRATTRNSKVQRVVRYRVAKLRFHPPKRSPVDRTLTNRRKSMEEWIGKSARGKALVNSAEAAGRMVGLDFGQQAEEEAGTGDLMVGLEFQGPVTEVLEGGDPMDVTGDDSAIDIDEVMIGSDVEAEMEVDEDTPDSDGDSGFVDADPMQLEEDGPQPAVNVASKPNLIPVGGLAQSGQQQAAPVTVSVTGNTAGAWAKWRQQQAAPVSVPVTGNAVASVLQGVAQNLISTNSAADLREARLGKRAEARVAPAQVAGPPPSSGGPMTRNGLITPPPSTTASTSSPEGAMAADVDTSDTTQPATTPSSTLPSSTSSTAPASPLSRDSATGDDPCNVPASGKAEPTASGDQSLKRGCEESDVEPEKPKADQRDEHAPANGPNVGKAEDDQKLQAPAASNASRARTASPPPPESSKRLQRQRPNDAESDQEIIPLNDIADQAPTGKSIRLRQLPAYGEKMLTLWIAAEEIQKEQLQAVFDSFDEAAFPEPDLDWPSDEDQPPTGKGNRKKRTKE